MNTILPSKYAATGRLFVFTTALLIAAIATDSGSASSQTFDCRTARAADEVTICREPSLAKLDQDLAALRRQRQTAYHNDVQDNEVAFLNARRRCDENRGCIEQSYRNRIQELARSLSDPGHERRANEKRAERQPGRDSPHSGFESPRQSIGPMSASRSKNPRWVHEPWPAGTIREGSGRRRSTAQQPKEQQGAGAQTRHALREQVNSGLVTIILGGLDSGDLSDAIDLVSTVKGGRLRILPVAGEGAAKDVTDLLFARGIDIALVQTDVLALLKRQAPFPGIENFLQYIAKLYDEEVHILARPEIHSLQDLTSKSVNFGPLDSGTFLTASAIFGALGIGVDLTTFPQSLALDKLRRGEIAALVYTAAKPARLFQAIRPEEGLHFLSISEPKALGERYGQSKLNAEDYPDLVQPDKPISTLSVGTVLAVYHWPAGTERYRKVAHFVDTFFGRLAELRMSRHHPKWREIDIHASVGGWTRFEAASQWIRSAERDLKKDIRIATSQLPMQGSTNSAAHMPSAGAGDVEPSIAEPAVNYPTHGVTDLNKELPRSPSTASAQEQRAQGRDRISFDTEQRDALFREFLEYQKRGAQKKEYSTNENDTLFSEFETYVKHLLH